MIFVALSVWANGRKRCCPITYRGTNLKAVRDLGEALAYKNVKLSHNVYYKMNSINGMNEGGRDK